ncbi:MAG TPA: radical SAM protein [Myxococcota bacterium]|nr:radical SAM protein [Myxococcota bacterium]
MRIAFVWINIAGPVGVSHGVLILARELLEAGHEVDVLHLNEDLGFPADPGRLFSELKRLSPGLVAFSFLSSHAGLARRLVAEARSALPSATIVCGGIHATLNPEEVFDWAGVDAVGIGELDGGHFVKFISRLEREDDPASVAGFWVRDEHGEHRNRLAPLPFIEHQALPLFEAIDFERFVVAKRGFGEIIAGRGCPYHCRFCQNHALVKRYRDGLGGTPASWPYIRLRSIDNLLAELKEMRSRAPSLKAIMFGDDRLAFDKAWLTEFAERYPAEIGLPFIANATADRIDAESAALLDRAGCNMIKLGVECAPGRIRKQVLGRPFDEATIRTAFGHLKMRGINTMAYLMVGIPTETPDDVLATFRFCAGLRPDALRVAMFCPFPGTEIHTELARSGLLEQTEAMYGFLEQSVLKWPAGMRAFLDKTLILHPWMVNQHLDEPVGSSARELVAWALSPASGSAQDPLFRKELLNRGRLVHDSLARENLPHYFAPFAERPDWAFLKIHRRRLLINVDDERAGS